LTQNVNIFIPQNLLSDRNYCIFLDNKKCPNWALSVNRSLPSAKKEAIKAAMIGLAENSPVLKAMDVTGFKPASDSQYDVIRRVMGD